MCFSVSEWSLSHCKCSVIINYDHHSSYSLLLIELAGNGKAYSKCIHIKIRAQFIEVLGDCYLKFHVVEYGRPNVSHPVIYAISSKSTNLTWYLMIIAMIALFVFFSSQLVFYCLE